MLDELSRLIADRLRGERARLAAQFATPGIGRTRLAILDDALPPEIAQRIHEAFPALQQMRLLSSFREQKYTSKSLEKMDPIIHDALFAFQAPAVIEEVGRITGIRDMVGDPQLYAGGISAMTRGQFLQPHIDNSHDFEGARYRVLNLLYYVSPGWRPEFGGNLELWDEEVRERLEVPSLFNRLVIMATNERSWHSVNGVKVEGARCCVSNYYFSPHSPNGHEVSHVTFFSARPEQPLLRLVSSIDGKARMAVRRILRRGLSRKDLYTGKRPNEPR